MFIKIKFLFFCLCLVGSSLAQSLLVSGIVLDENKETLPGVTVKIVGEDGGVTSDLNGEYSITVNGKTASLEFSYIGYTTQAVLVAGRSSINIEMVVSSESLDEVVVVGYGTSRVKELTGATVQVKGENIERLNIPRMDQALQGQVSGVTINTNSGSPGGSSSIRIRGLSTFGDNDPATLFTIS